MSAALQQFLAETLASPQLRLAERPALTHQSNRLYDAWDASRHSARHLIVKEFLITDEMDDSPLREYQALELMAPLDLAPRPVLYQPASSVESIGPLVVYEFMAGSMWDRAPRSAPDLAALAEGWRLMNSVPVQGLWLSRGMAIPLRDIADRFHQFFSAYADWAAQAFPAGLRVADQCLELLARSRAAVNSLDVCQPPMCFCRADPRFANVIGRPGGRIGFVDWEDSGLRDPARDLADVLTHANQEDIVAPELWSAFLAPYQASRVPVDPDIEHRLHLYLLIFPIYWLARQVRVGVERATSGRLADWSINDRPPNWRLRRYLARAAAWPERDFARQLETAQAVAFFPGVD